MMYQSTRDPSHKKYTSAEVIKMGLAPDGGLFLPETIPTLSEADIEALRHESYPVRAARILHMFLTDYTQEELMTDCHAAYREASFPGGAAPLVHVCNNLYALELWHGPTAAFKDMALQIMPRLLSRALVKTGETRHALILVATSGDTGKAALEGYRNVDRVKIMVFYPVDGVSRVQKLQMATQTGDNLRVVAIKGNFDDAQTGVKNIFADREMAERLNEHGYILSSANSINWGRLVPQIVYYISAYCDLLNKGVIRNGGANRRLRADRKLRQHFRRISCQTDGTAYPAAGLRLQSEQRADGFPCHRHLRPQSSVPSDHVPLYGYSDLLQPGAPALPDGG